MDGEPEIPWKWFRDEDHAVITKDWFDQMTGNTPSGIDLSTLESDLRALDGKYGMSQCTRNSRIYGTNANSAGQKPTR